MDVLRLITLALALALLSGCAALAGDPAALGPTAAAGTVSAQPTQPLSQPVEVTACLDGTPTVGAAEVQRAKDTLADAVADWADTADAVAVPELRLRVRRVDRRSYGDGEMLRMSVPGVQPLLPEPAVDDPRFLEALDQYEASRQARPKQLAAAVAAARAAADTVRPLDMTAPASEIAGCTSAAVESMDSTAARRLLLWSDLLQVGTAQIAGDLTGVAVLVVQVCDGDAARCAAVRDEFLATITARGGTATVVRPERAASVLPGFLRNGVA